MDYQNQTPKIYAQMAKIMGEIGSIEKERRNTQGQGYNYRGIDEVYNTMHSIMAKHGVICVPQVVERIREERKSNSGGVLIYTMLTVNYAFHAEDGSCIVAKTVGEAFDSGDKSSNKAMSSAQKYALLQTFCIPTKETKDVEADSPTPAPKNSAKSTPQPQKQAGGMTFEQAEAFIMPFGRLKGKRLSELSTSEIDSAAIWVANNASAKEKFKEFMEAAIILVNAAKMDAEPEYLREE